MLSRVGKCEKLSGYWGVAHFDAETQRQRRELSEFREVMLCESLHLRVFASKFVNYQKTSYSAAISMRVCRSALAIAPKTIARLWRLSAAAVSGACPLRTHATKSRIAPA